MRTKCKGKSTVFFADPPRIISGGTIVGDVEAQGPLGSYFDVALEDDTWGEGTWEKAERKMFEHAVRTAVEKGGLTPMQVDILLGGDLLNQIISANFAARELEIPFLGLYGACSTMAEGMLIGSMLIDGGFADRVACAASQPFFHGGAAVQIAAGDGLAGRAHKPAHRNRRGLRAFERQRLRGQRLAFKRMHSGRGDRQGC